MQQCGMACGIRNVDTAGQNRHSQPVDGQRRAVRRPVDSVGPAGDHRDIALGQPDRQVRRHVLAVAGRRAGPDDGCGPLRGIVEPRRAEHPQRQRRPALRFRRDRGAAERSERQRGPFVVIRSDQSTAATRQKFEILCSAVDFASRLGASREGDVDLALPHPVGSFDRAHPGHQSGELRARRLDDPREVSPCPLRRVGHRDAPGCRKLSAVATSSRPGERAPGQVAQRPRDPQRLVEPADTQQPAIQRRPQRLHRSVARAEPASEQCSAHLGVGSETVLAPALRRRIAGDRDPVTDLPRRLGFGGREHTHPHRMHLHSQVDAVEQRPGQSAEITPFDRRCADAVLRIGRCARDRVGRQDKLETGGIARHPVAAGKTNLPLFQRCSQCLQCADADLGALVEKQHPAVRPADGAGPGHSGTAADECGDAGAVMRCDERRPGDQRRGVRQQAGHRVNRCDLQRLVVRQWRQEPRKPLRQHRFTYPGRPGQHQVMRPGGGDLDRKTRLGLAHHVGQIRGRLRLRE